MKPATTLLITRPNAEAPRFLDAVRRESGPEVRFVISPLIETEATGCPVAVSGWEAAVVTSARAVEHADFQGDVSGRLAYCVGSRTAAAAAAAGFVARSADEDGKVLVQLILNERPRESLLYLRGEEVRVEIAQRLRENGLTCEEVSTYRQIKQKLTAEAQDALAGPDVVIVPLFSPNAAKTFRNQGPYTAPVVVLALSLAVAEELKGMPLKGLSICSRPDQLAMVELIATQLGGNSAV